MRQRKSADAVVSKTTTDSKDQLWQPHPGPQTAALECSLPDVCLGGARGGGKTLWLLLDWVQHATLYGKNASGAIFRKKFTPDLQDVINKGQKLLVEQLGWTYHATLHRWTSPDGAVLHAYYCETLEDALNYKGHEFSWIGNDEIGDWPDPAPLDFLWGCLRSSSGIPCVRRSTCNPGGPGHAWVKKRYRPEEPWVVREWQPQPADAPHIKIKSIFIPATIDDNPSINVKEYESSLAAVGSAELFKAWRYGNWDMVAGQYFDIFDPAIHVVKLVHGGSKPGQSEVAIEPWHQRWISMDWGFNDDTVILWHAITEDRLAVTYREIVINHTEPRAIGEIILANTGKTEKINSFYLGHDAFASRTSPRTIAQEIGAVVGQAELPLPCLADTDRVGGWQLMYQMLARGKWKISQDCPVLIESLPLLQRDMKKPEDIAESSVDHAPDAARYGLKTHLRSVGIPLEEQVQRALEGKLSQDPTIAMMQYRAVRGNLAKKGKKGGFRLKPRYRWA